ncbi:LPXTG cell wall anchor domain-containing protein [Micromonospora sp. KLBMP9576]|uniref:LPXTG cell wall anchor domain-containing protein n=1 Tax=Micromonospora sp. KLBMP9576 TaxID=3424769 RepID=UPI003D927B12
MIFRNRSLARIGAGALLASAALTAFGSPAQASGTETDLAIEVAGTRVAANAQGKIAFAKVTNNGKNTPSELAVRVDVSKVDFDKVAVVPAVDDGCEVEGSDSKPTAFVCYAAKDALPGAGETIDLPLVLFRFEAKGTYKAPISFKLVSKDDTNPDNNTKNATAEFSDQSGPDLSVVAEDVKQAVKITDGNPTYSGDLYAGGRSALTYFISNQGDQAAAGLKITVKLPKGVTPIEVEKGCEYAADKSAFTCTYENFGLIPQDEDTNPDDQLYSAYGFYHVFDVAADVKPGTLKGGLVSVEPIGTASMKGMRTAAVTLPANVTGMQAKDVDNSDNSDGYAVIVAAKGGAGGGDDNGGGLPVTGAQTGLVVGIGGAVLVAGAAMFMVARRRRVVLVTPGDEKSAV